MFLVIPYRSRFWYYLNSIRKVIKYIVEDFKIIYYKKKRVKTFEKLHDLEKNVPLRLHLGCGREYIKGYINLDINENSVADLILDSRKIKKHFEPGTVDEILMLHSISYLRYWEAKDFFTTCHKLLKQDGKLILEFPDIVKCAEMIIKSENNLPEYLEAVRAIYAFDMIEIKFNEKYTPYAFGWSAWHITQRLKKAGFNTIHVLDSVTHGNRKWRDTRIEAIKILIFSILHRSVFNFDFSDFAFCMTNTTLF